MRTNHPFAAQARAKMSSLAAVFFAKVDAGDSDEMFQRAQDDEGRSRCKLADHCSTSVPALVFSRARPD